MIERYWNADLIAKMLGAIFVLAGLAGFIANPLVSATGVFVVNDGHNLVHILSGVILLAGAFLGAPAFSIRGVALLYLVVAILGFVWPESPLFSYIEMNYADRWLHAGIAAALLSVGFVKPAFQDTSSLARF